MLGDSQKTRRRGGHEMRAGIKVTVGEDVGQQLHIFITRKKKE